MYPYQFFLTSSLFFIAGIFLKSLDFDVEVILLFIFLSFLLLLLFIFKKDKFYIYILLLLPFIIIGSVYYQWDNNKFNEGLSMVDQEEFVGIIYSNPVISNSFQEFKLLVEGFGNHYILVRTDPYPRYGYGDNLFLRGDIRTDFIDPYRNYLSKERVVGVIYYPYLEKSLSNKKYFKSKLFSFRNNISSTFKKLLPPTESSFLNGVILGDTKGMSYEFKNSLSSSGTNHLVALSGLHVAILIIILMNLFLSFLPRKISLLVVFVIIICFVLMTGAKPSIIRAVTMAFVAILATESGRIYDVRNAIILVALVIILLNPKVLVFDIGFQLSFLALMGIIYFKPIIVNFLKMKEGPGLFAWRENFLTSTSAQLAVAPILILNFDQISFVSILANMVILEFIPITIISGLILFLISKLSYILSFIFGQFVWALLFIETSLVVFFGSINPSIPISLGAPFLIIYYLVLLYFVYRYKVVKNNY